MGCPVEHPDDATTSCASGRGDASRRAFLARVSALVAGPLALTACRDDSPAAGRSGRVHPPADDASAADDPPPTEPEPAEPGDDEPRLALPETEPVIRVRVATIRDGAKRLKIGEAGTWIEVRAPALDGPEAIVGAIYNAPVTVGLAAAGWTMLDARGFRPTVSGREPVELRAVGEGASLPPPIALGDRTYPGALRLVALDPERAAGFDVVNHVPMERYLPGVIERELYRHWPAHTFAAQAVAARSYACAERSMRTRSHYDVTNTAVSQVYGGTSGHSRANEAVEATRGLVLAHAGGLVPGYYSSCCGGVAADARDAISSHPLHDMAPLRGRSGPDVCTEAKLFSWTIERARADVARRLAAWGRHRKDETLAKLERLRGVEIAALNPHGRPTAFAVSGGRDDAVTTLGAESFRRAVDFSRGGLGEPPRRLWSSNVRVTIDGETVRFAGAGHGHGVGMCQHGAEALARDGLTYEEILAWYYPQVELARAYA
jgi:stage II sporulation protein D